MPAGLTVEYLCERLEHAGVLLVHLWPVTAVQARVGLALNLADGALICALRALDALTAEEAGEAEVRVPLAGAASVDLARAHLERGSGWLSLRIPCADAPDGRAFRCAPADTVHGRDAVRERTGFDLRAASLRRTTRERAASAPPLACWACRTVLVPSWEGRLMELPRAAAHELADVTCACENTGCEWAAFLPAPARPDTPPDSRAEPALLSPAGTAASGDVGFDDVFGALAAERAPLGVAAASTPALGRPEAANGSVAHEQRSARARAAGKASRRAEGNPAASDGAVARCTLHGEHWVLLPRFRFVPAALRASSPRAGTARWEPCAGASDGAETAACGAGRAAARSAEMAAGSAGGRERTAGTTGAEDVEGAEGAATERDLVFRGPAHVAGWASGLLAPRAPPPSRRRRLAGPSSGGVNGGRGSSGGEFGDARGDVGRVQEWELARCAHCNTVVGAQQRSATPAATERWQRARAESAAEPGMANSAAGSGGGVTLGTSFGSEHCTPPGAAPDEATAAALGLGSRGLLGAPTTPSMAVAECRLPPFAWFEPELTAHTGGSASHSRGRSGGSGGLGTARDGSGGAVLSDGGGHVVLIKWRVCLLPPLAATAASAAAPPEANRHAPEGLGGGALGAPLLPAEGAPGAPLALGGGCAAGALGAALLAAAEGDGVGHFELWAAGDTWPSAGERGARAEARPGQGARLVIAVQVLGVYCAVLRGGAPSGGSAPASPAAVPSTSAVHAISFSPAAAGSAASAAAMAAPADAAPAASWRDSLRLLFAVHEVAETETAGVGEGAMVNGAEPAALHEWRARAGAGNIRRLRVLDDDLALALAQLRGTNARLPPQQRHLCGMSIGHLDVTPCLSS